MYVQSVIEALAPSATFFRPRALVLAFFGSLLWVSPAPALPQDVQIPSVQPGLSRVYGADSLYIAGVFSFSPDGRWIAFAAAHSMDRSHLYLVPSQGGEPIQLTRGFFNDGEVRWGPSGDRIYFSSDRATGPESAELHIMTLPLDPSTGRPMDLPRQVSIESVIFFDLSADGERLAYWTADSSRDLKVIPARGGPARLVLSRDLAEQGVSGPLIWSADGQAILFTLFEGANLRGSSVWQVPATGGQPELLSRGPERASISPNGKLLLLRGRAGGQAETVEYRITAPDGGPVARFTLPANLRPVHFFATDGRSILAYGQDLAAPVVVLPVSGGPPRKLKDGREYNWPYEWTTDGSEILFSTEVSDPGSETGVFLAPVDGGAMRQLRVPGPIVGFYPLALHPDRRHLFYVKGDEPEGAFVILDLENGSSREVGRVPLRAPMKLWSVSGCGGTPLRDAGRFLFFQEAPDRRILMAVSPGEEPRTLWSFRREEIPTEVAVCEDRIAWTEPSERYPPNEGSRSLLFVAAAGNEDSSVVSELPGYATSPLFSQDGQSIALAYARPGQAGERDVGIVELGPGGAVLGEPKVFDPVAKWWFNARWAPDGRALFVVGMAAESMVDTDVWMVPLQPGAPAVALTQDDPNSVWGFALSPDGRYIAYPSERVLGASIWRVELGEKILGGGR